MIRTILAATGFVILASLSIPALAQQPSADPDFMQKALDAIANQRNGALNAEAGCEANNGKLAQALKDAQAKIKTLEDAEAGCEANNGKLAQALKDAQAKIKTLEDAAAAKTSDAPK